MAMNAADAVGNTLTVHLDAAVPFGSHAAVEMCAAVRMMWFLESNESKHLAAWVVC